MFIFNETDGGKEMEGKRGREREGERERERERVKLSTYLRPSYLTVDRSEKILPIKVKIISGGL